MKLTGQCKKYFKRWLYGKEDYEGYYYSEFIDLSEAMQYGVLVDFFDSVGLCIEIWVEVQNYEPFEPLFYGIMVNDVNNINNIETRQEARTKAIEKANEIYNEKN